MQNCYAKVNYSIIIIESYQKNNILLDFCNYTVKDYRMYAIVVPSLYWHSDCSINRWHKACIGYTDYPMAWYLKGGRDWPTGPLLASPIGGL
jgi:hypothetical protein